MASVNLVHVVILKLLMCVSIWMCSSIDHREEEYNRILKHELFHIDTSQFETSNIIQFTAFNQLYKVKLEENPYINAAAIRHTNSFAMSSKAKPCHYLGDVMNTNESIVALSMCDNNGIRARIDAFDQVIIIKPSKYYLDPHFDSMSSHQITDQHLVYRLSDFNNTKTAFDIVAVPVYDQEAIVPTVNRRRLKYNNGEQYVEMLLMVGPFRIASYKSIYPSSWYDKVVQDHSDVINTAASIYASTSWSTNVGKIYLVLVEIELVSAFEGDYSCLYPSTVSSSCTDVEKCEIEHNDFLSKIRAYIYDKKDWNDFDNVMMFHHMDLKENTIGVAYRPGVGTWNSVGHVYVYEGLEAAAMTYVHELGHNLGIEHDQSYGCPAGYLMDKTANEGRSFSSCSITAVDDWFKTGYNACLQKPASLPSSDDIKSNYYMSCIEMKGHSDSALNGEYDVFGEYNDQPYYKHTGNSYTMKYATSNKWCIYSSGGIEKTCCAQGEIGDCNGADQAYTYYGCYNDKSDRALPYGPKAYGYDADSCSSACNAYTYFALQNNGWCCCGNDWNKATQYGEASGKCPQSKLGGAWLNDVFRNNGAFNYKGCYKDASTRALPYGPGTSGYTASTCSSVCKSYKYFGLQYNGECWCGNDWDRATQYGASSSCPSSQLGGSWCNDIFENVVHDDVSGTWDDNGGSSAYIDTCIEDTNPDGRMCGDIRYQCFSVTGLRAYIAGNTVIRFNGVWRARSDCHNGENTYELKSPNQPTMYMWRYKPWRWWKRQWMIEGDIGDGVIGGWLPQLSGDQALAICKEYDIAKCSGEIHVLVSQQSVGWSYTKDSAGKVSMSCDDAAFTMEDECFVNNEYGDALCVFDNSTLWNGTVQFDLFETCSNDEVVYFYTNINQTFYLHYDVYYPKIASNESVGRWIVTVDELVADIETYCEEDNLKDCIAGNWIFEREVDDSVSSVYDQGMRVSIEGCTIIEAQSEGKKTIGTAMVIMLVLVTVLGIILIGIALWCWAMSHKMRKHVKDETVDYNLMET